MLGAEWIDLPVASVDAVLCRWGYMLMNDPLAALLETRRVLRPGGHVALAVWDALEHNPWAQLPALELRERGLVASAPAEPGTPGPFALGDGERVRELLEDAGFTEIARCDAVAVEQRHRASRTSGRRRSTSRATSTTRCSAAPRRRSPKSGPGWPSAWSHTRQRTARWRSRRSLVAVG